MTKADAEAEFSIDEIPTRPDTAIADAVSGIRRRPVSLRLATAVDEKLDAVLLEYLLSAR